MSLEDEEEDALRAVTSRVAKLDLPDPGIPDTPTSSRLVGSSLLQSSTTRANHSQYNQRHLLYGVRPHSPTLTSPIC